MNTGIRRKVDDLGRVVIPAGIRRSLQIREGDAVEVHVEGDQVILSKPTDQCVFCGEEEDLQTFREKALCRGCVAAVGVLDEGMRRSRPPEPAAAEERGARPSELPPWPVGDRRGNGASRPSTGDDRPGSGGRSGSAASEGAPPGGEPMAPSRPPDRGGRDDQGPPASTTAW